MSSPQTTVPPSFASLMHFSEKTSDCHVPAASAPQAPLQQTSPAHQQQALLSLHPDAAHEVPSQDHCGPEWARESKPFAVPELEVHHMYGIQS